MSAIDVPTAQEADRWDEFVQSVEDSDVTQLSCWARVRAGVGYRSSYLLATGNEGIIGGAQILQRRVPLLGSVGYIANGPLVATSAAHRVDVVTALAEACAELARTELRMLVVQTPGDYLRTSLLSVGFRPSSTNIAPIATIRIDLRRPEEDIRADFIKRLRRWTTQWPKRGVSVREGDEHDVELLSRFMQASGEHQGYDPLSTDYIRAMVRELGPAGHLEIFVGEVNGVPVSAGLFTTCGGTTRFRLTGMDRDSDAATLKVPAAMVWEAIRRAKAAGNRTFDLGGLTTATATRVRQGEDLDLAALGGRDFFKASFGGQPFAFPEPVEMIPTRLVRTVFDGVRGSEHGKAAIARLQRTMRGARRTTRK